MLEGHHFQNGYVTRDIDKCVAQFRKSAQVDRIDQFGGASTQITVNGPAVLDLKIALIWIGDMHFELIQPVGGAVDLYSDALPADDGMKFHHICMRVSHWGEFRARVDRQPYPVVLEGSDDQARFLYLDTREFLGHYVEYAWVPDDRWKLMLDDLRQRREAAV